LSHFIKNYFISQAAAHLAARDAPRRYPAFCVLFLKVSNLYTYKCLVWRKEKWFFAPNAAFRVTTLLFLKCGGREFSSFELLIGLLWRPMGREQRILYALWIPDDVCSSEIAYAGEEEFRQHGVEETDN
jgi:hypothetical protein